MWSNIHLVVIRFFVKQKTAYWWRISDWSADVCSSDLPFARGCRRRRRGIRIGSRFRFVAIEPSSEFAGAAVEVLAGRGPSRIRRAIFDRRLRSEEHTSELQSLMRISYAVFCLKIKTL